MRVRCRVGARGWVRGGVRRRAFPPSSAPKWPLERRNARRRVSRVAHAHGVLPEVQFVVPHVGVDGEDDALEVGDVAGGAASWRRSTKVALSWTRSELILEEGALADQRFVLGVRLDGRLGVRQEVLELVQHLASGGGEWDRRGAWERKGDEGGREREDVSADAEPRAGGTATGTRVGRGETAARGDAPVTTPRADASAGVAMEGTSRGRTRRGMTRRRRTRRPSGTPLCVDGTPRRVRDARQSGEGWSRAPRRARGDRSRGSRARASRRGRASARRRRRRRVRWRRSDTSIASLYT